MVAGVALAGGLSRATGRRGGHWGIWRLRGRAKTPREFLAAFTTILRYVDRGELRVQAADRGRSFQTRYVAAGSRFLDCGRPLGRCTGHVFGYGLYALLEQSFWYAGILMAVGLGGIGYLTAHLRGRRLAPKAGAMALMLVATWGLIGYQIWYLPHQSTTHPNAPTLTAFTPSWLTFGRVTTFKSGALSVINASGNLPSTKIETVAEPESSKFANALVDVFIISGFPIQDDGQGNRVGIPTTHRLAPGITIAAPVPSLAAEAVRVGLERMGIQTRRSIDHSRTGDYLIVEVGPAP